MKNKGIKNIEIADCLNERIINGTKSKECFKGYTREELYPLIVNRWYYGLYLIAKDSLGSSGKDIRQHRNYVKDNNIEIQGLWDCVSRKGTECSEILGLGEDLYALRNYFDYNASKSVEHDHKKFEEAKNIYGEILPILMNLLSEESKTQGK